ncbi:MAG TPA: hypothetical protein VMQ11_19330 [Alphaproteobacteria bacterium]|nr:hypothetical protein [Alphaproteobacteria bacterium]
MGAQADTVAAPAGPLVCRVSADLYSVRSRRIIGRLCREFLDRARLTPLELLHSPAAQRQYLDNGTDYQAAVQKSAVAQAKTAGQDVTQRMRALYALVDGAAKEAADRLKGNPPPPVDPATFAAFVAAARKAELTEVGDFFVNAALTTYLAGGKTWADKVERLRLLADGAPDAAVVALVDTIMAETIASVRALGELIGPPVPMGPFLAALVDLLCAPVPAAVEHLDGGAKLRSLLSHHALPETRATLLEHLRAGLKSTAPLAAGPPAADLDAHLRLVEQLGRAGDAAGGETMRGLLGDRIGRSLTVDALAGAMRRFARPDVRMIQALHLYRMLGDSPGRNDVRQYVEFLFESERLLTMLAKAPEPTTEKLRRVAGLLAALQASGLSQAGRARFVEPLQALQLELRRQPGAPAPGTDERRIAPRVPNNPEDHVILNNVRFALRNWSPRGLLFGPVANPPSVGTKIGLKVNVILASDRARFDATGEVMRVVNGDVAVAYECAAPETRLLIQKHFNSIA